VVIGRVVVVKVVDLVLVMGNRDALWPVSATMTIVATRNAWVPVELYTHF
jgi:hypothetical protein